jgi:hypothetical protein
VSPRIRRIILHHGSLCNQIRWHRLRSPPTPGKPPVQHRRHDRSTSYRNHSSLPQPAVPPEYLAALNDEESDLVDVSCKTIITHLWEQFGEITQAELQTNIQKMESQWSTETPIAALFARIDDCRRFAEAGDDIISEKTTIRAAYNIIAATGRFTEPYRAWRMLPTAQNTWANFKLVFAKAHKDLSTTSQVAGYHSANAVSSADSLEMKNEIKELKPSKFHWLKMLHPTKSGKNPLLTLPLSLTAGLTVTWSIPSIPVSPAPVEKMDTKQQLQQQT